MLLENGANRLVQGSVATNLLFGKAQCLCSTASEEQYNEVCVYDSTLESLDSRPYKLSPHTHKGHRVRGRVC